MSPQNNSKIYVKIDLGISGEQLITKVGSILALNVLIRIAWCKRVHKKPQDSDLFIYGHEGLTTPLNIQRFLKLSLISQEFLPWVVV